MRDLSARWGDQVKFSLDVSDAAAGAVSAELMRLALWIWLLTTQDMATSRLRRHAYLGLPCTDRDESLRDIHRYEGSYSLLSQKEGGHFAAIRGELKQNRCSPKWFILL
jgi:ribosomal protein L39E